MSEHNIQLSLRQTNLETYCNRLQNKTLSKHVQAFHYSFADYYLTQCWALVNPIKGMPPYTARYSMATDMAMTSMKLKYLCGILHSACTHLPPRRASSPSHSRGAVS